MTLAAPQGKRLLVLGASGLLGINLALEASPRYQVTGSANAHPLKGAPFKMVAADLAQPGAAAWLVASLHPDLVVNCAAWANIDACEKDPAQSARMNADLPGELAEACRKAGARLAHISTDAVFDGVKGSYSETDETHPQGVYARDKLAGEQAVAQANPDAVVARVNFYGWSLLGGRSLAEFFYHSLSEGRRVNGFTDVLFCPLEASRLSLLLLEMLERGLSGLFHVYSSEHQSKYEFGCALARKFGLDDTLIAPISVFRSGLVARRSPNLTMRVDKIEAALGRPMPGQAEQLEYFYQLYRQGRPEQFKAFI